MDSMVEENGNGGLDPLDGTSSVSEGNHQSLQQQQQQQQHQPQQHHHHQQQQQQQVATILPSGANIVQYISGGGGSSIQVIERKVPSVIQANQSSVIQTATNNMQPGVTLSKGVSGPALLYLNKSNSVIHTTPGIQLQIKHEPVQAGQLSQSPDSNCDDSSSEEDSPKRRRDLLTRRPSYHRILKDITAPDITATDGLQAIQTGGGGGPTLVQYTTQSQDGQQFFVPGADPTRKREIRLQKNREAARECRRKKKEYIKCLENRVAVLENQNKALIEELKALKELYCQQKTD